MVNEFTCNHTEHSDSIMSQHLMQKTYSVKIGWHYIVSYICYITFIESDYFLWVMKSTKYLYKKVYVSMCKQFI